MKKSSSRFEFNASIISGLSNIFNETEGEGGKGGCWGGARAERYINWIHSPFYIIYIITQYKDNS